MLVNADVADASVRKVRVETFMVAKIEKGSDGVCVTRSGDSSSHTYLLFHVHHVVGKM
jgi:hypothetical protein